MIRPIDLANALREEASRVENVRTARQLLTCHDRIIDILIEMADLEAEMANGPIL